jgi:hypothetical protein
MNWKKLVLLGCVVACVFAAPPATAQMRGHRNSMGRMPMHRPLIMNSPSGIRRWGDRDFDQDDRFHRFNHFNEVIFIGDFGFPWSWGWGPWWGYPYGYYGGYGSGYGYGDSSGSRVAELQRLLAHAGYYHGAIDGIIGPATRRAIRAYERDHGYVG